MREDLQERWNSVQSRKWRVLEAVARLPEDARARKVPGSDWTPVQIVEHIVLAEEDGLSRIDAAAKQDIPVKPSLAFRLGVPALRAGMRIPAREVTVPTGSQDLEELGRRWDSARERLLAALEEESDRKAFSIGGFFGALSADHVLDVIDAHLQYHQRELGAK